MFQPSASAGSQYPFLRSLEFTKRETIFYKPNQFQSNPVRQIVLLLTNEEKSLQGDSLTYIASYGLNVPTSSEQLPNTIRENYLSRWFGIRDLNGLLQPGRIFKGNNF